jgi:molecular chaperone GrpE (heat shock protein)
MNVALEQDADGGQEMAAQQPGATVAAEPLMPEKPSHATPEESPGSSDRLCDDQGAGPAAEARDEALLMEIRAAVRELADSSERYHTRAEQREGVIDHLRDEVDRLRRGERRGLLRPLLVDVCRLRNDLLRQADGLPDDYDVEQAARLLRSYAESVELTLESCGVVAFEPDSGNPFDPRMHRRVGAEPTSDPALVGRIARVRRSGYLDVDVNSPIAAAEVVLFTAASDDPGQPSSAATPQPESVTINSEVSQPGSSLDKRDEL